MDWQNILTLLALIAVPAAVIIGQVWVKSYVKNGVQHSFDKKLEALRAEFRNADEMLKSELRRKEAENASLRDAVFGARGQRLALLDKRRIEAVERLWAALVGLAPLKTLSATMSVINFKPAVERAARDPKFREVMAMFTAGKLPDPPSNTALDVAVEQPFLTPLAWAYYSAYSSVLYSAFARAKILELGVNTTLDIKRITRVLKVALPHQAAFVDEQDAGAYHHLLDELETCTLTELKRSLEGTDVDHSRVAEAQTILEEVGKANAETADDVAKAKVEISAKHGWGR